VIFQHLTAAAIKRRVQSIINDKAVDAQTRVVIRDGLEINDPWLPQLMRCVDAGESIIENLYVHSSEKKIEALTDLICRAGDEPSAALLVLLNARKLHPPKRPSQTQLSTLPSLAAPS
jgi:hypothetical protein